MYSSTAQTAFTTRPQPKDPYKYQVGFGNRFATEALPGVLPDGQNNPQNNKYGLYNEVMTGSPFVAPRAENLSTWLYRIKPSVAHQGFTRLPDNPDLESNFLPLNPKVHVSPTQWAWHPFKLPPDNEKVDWVQGLKTIVGNGDPTLREGLAIHVYLANTSMNDKEAFCNSDGDMLIMPQQGRLDIQTEFGKMMVRPGELCVIQRGMKFRVDLPDGPSRGYVQEIFGSHYILPDLGPLGGHGLANPRDFETPLASFDVDQSPWYIVYKVAGQLHICHQEHTPFDVVAWHGNYVPYKYAMEKFVFVGSISRDHIDPSSFCILTAKSKQPGVPLTDVCVAGERWDVASQTFRPPYFHRNSASEFVTPIYGSYGGFMPGGANFLTGFCPHGVPYDMWKRGAGKELKPEKVSEGTIIVMLETGVPLTISEYAMNRCGTRHEHDPKLYNFKANFLDHIDQINADLKAEGLPQLDRK